MISELKYTIPFDKISDKIIHKKAKLQDHEYWVINYDVNYTCDDDLVTGLYRSVIYDSTEKLLAFSTPKSMVYETFKQKYITNTENSDPLFINEIVEGTMIQLFYDVNHGIWEIATKGAVGANYWYYRNQYMLDQSAKQPTFRQMFLESLSISDFTSVFETFNKSWSYTFVLQHPANHIVLNIQKPKLYLVSVYEICRDTSEVRFVSPLEYEPIVTFNEFSILFPTRFVNENVENLVKEHCSIHSSNLNVVGLMFTNLKTGERSALENPNYVQLRELRGNNPNLQYQYLCLKSMGKVDDFLKAFPQYKEIFWKFYMNYSDFVTNLHQSYLDYYIKKLGIKISKQYFPLIYKMHREVYLPSLSTEIKIIIKRGIVQEYVKKIPPGELIYYLNYVKE